MASTNNNAGSFGNNSEGNIPATTDCTLHPGPTTACEKCMDDLKMDLATTRDILTRTAANEERKNMELMVAKQKLSRFMKHADKTRTELDGKLAEIISEAGDARDEISAKLDDLANEVTQKLAGIKLTLVERLAPIPLTPKQAEAAATSQATRPPAKPTMCWPHKLLREDSDKCTDEHCSMRGQRLAAPKRPHPKQEQSDRLTKRINVDLQPPPTTSHFVVERDGDESWSTEGQPAGETGDNEDDEIVYLGEGQTITK